MPAFAAAEEQLRCAGINLTSSNYATVVVGAIQRIRAYPLLNSFYGHPTNACHAPINRFKTRKLCADIAALLLPDQERRHTIAVAGSGWSDKCLTGSSLQATMWRAIQRRAGVAHVPGAQGAVPLSFVQDEHRTSCLSSTPAWIEGKLRYERMDNLVTLTRAVAADGTERIPTVTSVNGEGEEELCVVFMCGVFVCVCVHVCVIEIEKDRDREIEIERKR